jgi:hypothetical protein
VPWGEWWSQGAEGGGHVLMADQRSPRRRQRISTPASRLCCTGKKLTLFFLLVLLLYRYCHCCRICGKRAPQHFFL